LGFNVLGLTLICLGLGVVVLLWVFGLGVICKFVFRGCLVLFGCFCFGFVLVAFC